MSDTPQGPWGAPSGQPGPDQPAAQYPPPPPYGQYPPQPPAAQPYPPQQSTPQSYPAAGQPAYGQPAPQAAWAPPPGWSAQQPPAWPAPAAPPAVPPGAMPPAPPGWPGQVPAWGQHLAAPKPGIVPLRPLGVGELLDGALGLIRSNPKTVLGLAAAVSAISAVLQTLGLWASYMVVGNTGLEVAGAPTDLEAQLSASVTSAAVQIVPALVSGLLQVVAGGLFMVLVGAAVLGRRLDTGATWALLRPRLLGLVGLSLIVGLASLLFLAALVGGVVGLGALFGGVGVAIGVPLALAGLVVGGYLYVRLALASPALVIEARSPWGALGRSWRLVRGSFWRVLGILLLAAVIVNVLATVVTVPFLTVSMVATATSEVMWPVILATGLATLISGIVTLPFSAAVTGLLYTDLRIRREALDIELVAAGVDPQGDPLLAYRHTLG